MALWPSRARAAVDAVRVTEQTSPQVRSTYPPFAAPSGTAWDTLQSVSAVWAMQVPAFARGVRLISGTVAQLPLTQWNTYEGVPVKNTFLAQPEADRPYWVTMQRTVRDLVLHGRAYWLVQDHDGALGDRGYPLVIKHIDSIGDHPVSNGTRNGVARGEVIVFDGFTDGVLSTGWQVLEAALALEVAAGNYAAVPAPTQILKNTSNYELSPDEIDELLLAYTNARRTSSVAYLNGGVDLTTFGYSAHDLQLVEARNQSAIQVARLLNLDPFWVGAGVPGSALTYQNRVDMRTDLVDLTLSDYLNPVEQRLSMPDVMTTRHKNRARFDTAEFLRTNLDTRARLAIDLLEAGIIDRDEARDFVSDRQSGGPA